MIRQISTILLWLNRSGFGLLAFGMLLQLLSRYRSDDGDDEEIRDLILLAGSFSFGFFEIVFAIGAKHRAWKTALIALGTIILAFGIQIVLNIHDRTLPRCPQETCGASGRILKQRESKQP